MSEQKNNNRIRNIIYFVLSLVTVAAIFGYLLTHVSIRDVVSLIRNINLSVVWVFLVLSLSMSFFRMWRYDIVLKTAGYSVRKTALFLVVLVRNFCSDLLPARIGTVVYIYLVNSRMGIPFAPAASSFALAFLFDIIALAPMIGIAALWAGAEAGLSVVGLLVGGGVLLAVSAVLLYSLPFMARWGAGLVGGMRFLGEERSRKWCAALVETGRQIEEARAAGIYGRLLVLSFLVRFLKYASLYFLLYAMLKPLGYDLAMLSVPKVFIGLCACELAASLPVGTIIGMGAYEGTWAFIFTLLGFPAALAMQTSISHHIFTQVYGYGLGIAALLVLLLPYFRTEGEPVKSHSKPAALALFCCRVAVWCLGFAFCAVVGCSAVEKVLYAESDVECHGPSESEKRALAKSGLEGRIYFDSNRGGTFGIWSMKGDGTDIGPVIDDDRAEMFPDISPDGRMLVYASAFSPHRMSPADVWISKIDGSGARKLVENGTFPTFSSDGGTVYFERDRKMVMAVKLDGTGIREVFPAGNDEFSGNAIIKPRVSPDRRWIAFISDKGKGWNSWAVNVSSGRAVHIGKGCEPSWFPDSRRLVYVNQSGDVKGGTGLFCFDLESGSRKKLQDGDEPWGHEYFPGISPDGCFLFWSACPPGQHAHETSNYQLFVRDCKAGTVTRLIYDGHNNRWPKYAP